MAATSELGKIVEQYGADYVADLVQVMQEQGSVNLYNQISDPVLVETVKMIVMTINVPKSVYYFSEGRGPGKWPPYNPIKKWIIDHNIYFRNQKGQFNAGVEAMVFLTRRKIGRVGTFVPNRAPSHFLQPFGLTDEFMKKLGKEYKNTVRLGVISMLKKSQIGTIE
jgi:hypothetical protein